MIRLFLLVYLVLAVRFGGFAQPGNVGPDVSAWQAIDSFGKAFNDRHTRVSQKGGIVKSATVTPLQFSLCRNRAAPKLMIKGERIKAGEVVIGRSRYTVLAFVVPLD